MWAFFPHCGRHEVLSQSVLLVLPAQGCRCRRFILIANKSLLSVGVPEDEFIFLDICNLCIFRNTFLITSVVFFNCLHYLIVTGGKYGAGVFLLKSLSQSKPSNQGCSLIYLMPLVPSRFAGFLSMREFTKSTLSLDHS